MSNLSLIFCHFEWFIMCIKYFRDPFDNVQLEQALDRAIIKTGTKIPVLKVTRSPSNKSIYGPFVSIIAITDRDTDSYCCLITFYRIGSTVF